MHVECEEVVGLNYTERSERCLLLFLCMCVYGVYMLNARRYIHTYTYITYTCMNVIVSVCVCVCVCVYEYAYIHTHTYIWCSTHLTAGLLPLSLRHCRYVLRSSSLARHIPTSSRRVKSMLPDHCLLTYDPPQISQRTVTRRDSMNKDQYEFK